MHARIAVFLLAVGFSTIVGAAPCAGFTDVDDTDPLIGTLFCQNVEWIKNRKVTSGCTGTTYCPHSPVSRLQMARFMNQLGTALTPVLLRAELASGALVLNNTPVVCATPEQPIEDYPRRAFVDVSLSATAPTAVDIALQSVYSTNNGASWTPLSAVQSLVSVPAAQWGQASDLGTLDLNVGQAVRFGVQVARSGAGSVDLSDSRCVLRALIGSRTGAASPL